MLTCLPLRGEKMRGLQSRGVRLQELERRFQKQPAPDAPAPGFRTQRNAREGVSRDACG